VRRNVARISIAVLKWLIPVLRGRFRKTGTGRNLDLPPFAGYLALEMFSSTIRTRFAQAGEQFGEIVRVRMDEFSLQRLRDNSRCRFGVKKP
jgi:hypothetical protein